MLCILEMVNAILNRPGIPALRRRFGSTPTFFDGVKRDGLRFDAVRERDLSSTLACRGEVAYCIVVTSERLRTGFCDMRAEARERARLRSVKLLDAAYCFLSEGRIFDRSLNGLRVLLAINARLPNRFALYIDDTREVRSARLIWRHGAMMGVRLLERVPHGALRPSQRFALRGRYYGVSN